MAATNLVALSLERTEGRPTVPVAVREKVRAVSADVGGQAKLARILGVHKTTVIRWETERRHPQRSLQVRIEALVPELRDAPTSRNPNEDEKFR